MKQSTIVTVVLAILLVISVVQAVQLSGLKTKLSSGELSIGSSTSSTPSLSSSGDKRTSAVPSSIKDLPTMVGGC
jgi:hypothetical protein